MTWRHAEAEHKGITFPGDVPGGCIRCLWDDAPEPCRNPTPDPTSPCGYVYVEGDGGERCAWEPQEHRRSGMADHPHLPTRCTCGHPIEEALR